MSTFVIPAECHTDDFVAEIKFDAVQWFEQASDKEILDLAECGWGGDYPADEVAEHFEKSSTKPMFDYKHAMNLRETMGFECHVDEAAAVKWVTQHRPGLLDKNRQSC